MTTLVVGASGATGRILVDQLVKRGQHVRIIVRSTNNLADNVASYENLSVTHASLLDLNDIELAQHKRASQVRTHEHGWKQQSRSQRTDIVCP